MSEQTKMHIIPTGGLWEETQWEIHENYVMQCSDIYRCHHCSEPKIVRKPKTEYLEEYDQTTYTCPRVVVATNEGGYASTGICLDCILEAEARLFPK